MKCEVQRWRQDLGRLLLVRTSWADKYSRLDVSTKIRIIRPDQFIPKWYVGQSFFGRNPYLSISYT